MLSRLRQIALCRPVILQENQTTAAVLRFEATNAPPIPRELWAYTLAQLDGLLNKKEVSPNHSKALRLEASSLGSVRLNLTLDPSSSADDTAHIVCPGLVFGRTLTLPGPGNT